jgi:hypothetical protein
MKRNFQELEKEINSLSKLGEEVEEKSSILNENFGSKKPLLKNDREDIKTFCRIKPIENDPGKLLY